MVSSPMYERLKTFMEAARANKGLEAWDKDHARALEYFDDAVELLRSYRDGHGFTGATGTAMDRWVDASVQRITKYREAYERGFRSYSNGRGVMATALAESEKISADLIDAETEAMRDDLVVAVPDSEPGPGIRAMGKLFTTGAAYVEAVEAQANAQREAAAERILTMLNSSTKAISVEMEGRSNSVESGKGLEDYEEEERQKDNNSGGGGSNGGDSHTAGRGAGGWGYSSDDDFGRAKDRSSTSGNYPGGFDQPWWSEADAAAARSRIVSSGAVETRELPYGELGSRTNPITDPQELMSRDLLHTRVNGTTYRNGVVGGHTPAPPRGRGSPTVAPQRRCCLRRECRRPARWSRRARCGCTRCARRCPDGYQRSCGRAGRHAWHHRYDQRPGRRGCLRPQGRLLLRFRLRLLHSPRGRKWRYFWCWRCCGQRFWWIHGHRSRRWCWGWQGRQEASQAPVHGLQVRGRRGRAARRLRESPVSDLRLGYGYCAGEAYGRRMGPPPVVNFFSHATLRSHFGCEGRVRRAARALTTAASALALATGVLTLAPAPTQADDAVPSQEYFSYYYLDSAREKGFTGKGVTIALIDGPVNTSAPALKGAKITDKSRCTIEASPENARHGTDMATILVSPYTGVAPDATLYTYQVSNLTSVSGGSCDTSTGRLDTFGKLINQAVEDGAQIISISQSDQDGTAELKWAIANAISRGVIIVNSAGNGASDDNVTHIGRFSGVVGVSAINADGTFASYSSWGDGVVTTALGGPYNTYDVNTGAPTTVNGSSISAPIVAGILALTRQKWPNATTNQILQLLVHTSLNPNHEWNKYTGYGAASLADLINTDPSQYPDENPIIQKPNGSSPTVKEIQDYTDGIAFSSYQGDFPSSYVYRGVDEGVVSVAVEGMELHLGTSPRYHRK